MTSVSVTLWGQVRGFREEAERGRQAVADEVDRARLALERADSDALRRCDAIARRLPALPAASGPSAPADPPPQLAASAAAAARERRREEEGRRAVAAVREEALAAAEAAGRRAADEAAELRRELAALVRHVPRPPLSLPPSLVSLSLACAARAPSASLSPSLPRRTLSPMCGTCPSTLSPPLMQPTHVTTA
jgi:hypothetical protein